MMIASAFDSYKTNEMVLAERLIETTPDNSLTMFEASTLWDYLIVGTKQVKSATG